MRVAKCLVSQRVLVLSNYLVVISEISDIIANIKKITASFLVFLLALFKQVPYSTITRVIL